MGSEIERKFRPAELPREVAAVAAEEIQQGYLAVSGDVEVRIRRRGGRHVLTVKGGTGLVRTEEEVAIDAAVFDRLWPLTEGRRVEKRRRAVEVGELVAEVDEFTGHLEGLVVVEVEFASEPAAAQFSAPGWFGREVTDDPQYRNANLATASAPPPTRLP